MIARDILTACMYYLIDKKKSILYNQLFMCIFCFELKSRSLNLVWGLRLSHFNVLHRFYPLHDCGQGWFSLVSTNTLYHDCLLSLIYYFYLSSCIISPMSITYKICSRIRLFIRQGKPVWNNLDLLKLHV